MSTYDPPADDLMEQDAPKTLSVIVALQFDDNPSTRPPVLPAFIIDRVNTILQERADETNSAQITPKWELCQILTEEEETRRGALLASMLLLRRDPGNRERWPTTGGNKTDLGLFRTVKRLIEEGQ